MKENTMIKKLLLAISLCIYALSPARAEVSELLYCGIDAPEYTFKFVVGKSSEYIESTRYDKKGTNYFVWDRTHRLNLFHSKPTIDGRKSIWENYDEPIYTITTLGDPPWKTVTYKRFYSHDPSNPEIYKFKLCKKAR